MFARIICHISIAALIACPTWCGSGLCRVAQCCSAQPLAACPDTDAASCCNKKCPTDGETGNERPSGDAPCKSSCQGVCGGAIFVKPFELNDPIDSSFLPLFVAGASIADELTEYPAEHDDHLSHCRANHGRFLRTLHNSLLC